jgi:hypothetical protein
MRTILGIGHSQLLLEKDNLTGIIAFDGMTGKLQTIATNETSGSPVPFLPGDNRPRSSHERQRDSDYMQQLIHSVAMPRKIVLQEGLDHSWVPNRSVASKKSISLKESAYRPGSVRDSVLTLRDGQTVRNLPCCRIIPVLMMRACGIAGLNAVSDCRLRAVSKLRLLNARRVFLIRGGRSSHDMRQETATLFEGGVVILGIQIRSV